MSCLVPSCGRGRLHAGSHGPAPAQLPVNACPPGVCWCTSFVCAAAGRRPYRLTVRQAIDEARSAIGAAVVEARIDESVKSGMLAWFSCGQLVAA